MPIIVTDKIARHGEGMPRNVLLRITWPSDNELQRDTARSKSGTKVFVLKMLNADDASQGWQEMNHFETKAQTQIAADGVVGREVRSVEWKECDGSI